MYVKTVEEVPRCRIDIFPFDLTQESQPKHDRQREGKREREIEKGLALILKSAVCEILISIVEFSGPRVNAAFDQILDMPT